MADDDEDLVTCWACDGHKKVECPECQGTGQAIGPDGKIHPCLREITCWTCGGTGKVRKL